MATLVNGDSSARCGGESRPHQSTARGGRRRRFAGDTSIISAITRPTIGHSDQTPCHQFWTAVYHKNVVGRKRKPSTGQSAVVNKPLNQFENNHNKTINKRGAASVKIANRQGMF
jgi:hypothetical protein